MPVSDLIWMEEPRFYLPNRSPGQGCSGNPFALSDPPDGVCFLLSSPPPNPPRRVPCGVEAAVVPSFAARRHYPPGNGRRILARPDAAKSRSAWSALWVGATLRREALTSGSGCHLALWPQRPSRDLERRAPLNSGHRGRVSEANRRPEVRES